MADEEVATKALESDAQEDVGKYPTTDDPVARAGPTMGVKLSTILTRSYLQLMFVGTLHHR
jgi:hypothetical protein